MISNTNGGTSIIDVTVISRWKKVHKTEATEGLVHYKWLNNNLCGLHKAFNETSVVF